MIIVVLFNLKPGVSETRYAEWAKTTDIPNVRALGSVRGFEVLRVTGLFGSADPAPYAYVELLEVTSVDALVEDVSGATMQRVAAEFAEFADAPKFLLTEAL